MPSFPKIIPSFVIRKKPPVIVSGGNKLPPNAPAGSYIKNGQAFNKQGQRLNDKGQAVDKHGHLINAKNQRINSLGQRVNSSGQAIDDKERLINEKGHLINTQGKLINDKGHLVDVQGRLVNASGRLVNTEGHLIDRDGKLVNREGFLVDKAGRPLDKDGKIARDKASMVKGNNEAHEQLLPPKITQQVIDWKNKAPKPVSLPKMTIADATARMMDAEKMVKAGVIPSSPSAARVARDSAISAGITGVVSAPINIAAYAGSTAASEQIKASYLPQPMVPPTPSANSLVGRPEAPKEPDVTPLYPRMDDAQVTAFTVTNQTMALRYGDTKAGFLPSQNWSKDPLERMTQLEDLLDFAEEHTKELADLHEVFFKPHLADKAPATGMDGLAARLGTIENRISKLNQAQAKVVKSLSARIASE
ncbi:hypothetical protein [Pseudomonas sp. FP2309]|uniref:hypothetical protein n=1 Tax=Pseudomonas sp. FP2309 TaxID=2954091 RepID=UPI0027376034|nr:hypothetical protein [Pseudomonas sp. FP2309]WLH67881.1 hypothetical protein PSH59_22700 [Pseudomonas sp. FP2309]